ncbi:MAG: hypothetical protein DI533_04705 [Cereibacter sphaeroides]|uniref:Uncharacterized protein n=1 Tax=Cereibacter sphaeroides TaxID=1063 RepID=A0A2W5U9B8_CERSP|nr:MAG: hypothetical protein DI533_04705 [Cereibacter sphaeroides]
MTVETFDPAPLYTVSGVGPYLVPHAYVDGTIMAVAGEFPAAVPLTGADFDMVPASSLSAGTMYLSSGAAAAHAGKPLRITRRTPREQGWLGLMGEREAGLESQLDLIVMGLQEVSQLVLDSEDIANAQGYADLAQGAATAALGYRDQAAGILGAVQAIQNLIPIARGNWASGVLYGAGNTMRSPSGYVPAGQYQAMNPHLSGTFAADVSAGRLVLYLADGPAGPGTGNMMRELNLSDLTSIPTAQENIGLKLAGKQDFMPVQQGGGEGQGNSKVYLGWHTGGYGLKVQVDASDQGFLVTNPSAGDGAATRLIAPGDAPLYAVRAVGKFSALAANEGWLNISAASKTSGGNLYTIYFTNWLLDTAWMPLIMPREVVVDRIKIFTLTADRIQFTFYNGATPVAAPFTFVGIR